MDPISALNKQIPLIEERLGHAFKDKSLLIMAFVHRSFFNEYRDLVDQHNERLEFLGDCVLGLLVSDYLYNLLPSQSEGDLSHIRAHIVDASACVQFLQKLGVAQYVLLGKGERMNDGKGRETILADLFEALIGAIYLDRGYEYCERFIQKRVIIPYVDIARLEGKVISYKSLLIEWCQKEKKQFHYDIFEDNGIGGERLFGVRLSIDDKVIAKARATSKKKAEEKASQRAYFAFQKKIDNK